MSIVPIRAKWKIKVKKIDGAERTVEIDQAATVRKLYSTVRNDLRRNWGFQDAIQLFKGPTLLVKNDSKIRDSGIYNEITLSVVAQTGPDQWDLFVTLPGRSSPSTITLNETATCDDLYKKVAEVHGNGRPLCVKDPIGDALPEGKATLQATLVDGARLTAEYRQKWSLIILNQGGKSTLTIEISANAYVRDVFEEVRKKIPVGEGLILNTGIKELNNCMNDKITSVGLTHMSSICVVMRQRGGGDPRVQMLQNCPNKDVVGVSTPSIRACPYCGALVQHADACKHMTCPACSREFCFICLRKKEGGWQCGSYNSRCSPASRQTYIPG